jgi:hypothetical protein
MRSANADHQIHQRLEGEGRSQTFEQNVLAVVDTPTNLEKNDQENLQTRRREKSLTGICSAARVLAGLIATSDRRNFVMPTPRVGQSREVGIASGIS